MRILVTGGAGYIGTELISQLVVRPEVTEVILFDNLSRPNYNLFLGNSKLRGGKITFVEGELLNSRLLRKIMKGVDVVYHLAAKVTTPFADQNPHLFEQINHWGTAEVVYAAEELGVSKFIYLSSVSVYGSQPEEADTNTSPNPRTFYGISKMRGEEHVRRLGEKLPVFIARCGNVYGYSRSMRFDAVINKFMFEANFKNQITINGDGQQHRAFIHINKVVQSLIGMLDVGFEPTTYNLVEHNFSIQDISEQLQELFPEMEMLYVNHHMQLRELKVRPDARINTLFESKALSFSKELADFKKQFTF